MPPRPTRRARPGLDRLESRDTPGNAFGDFFSGLVGRAEVLAYYGAGAVEGAFEHGPTVHAQSRKQRREQRALEIAHVSVIPSPAVSVEPAILAHSSVAGASFATTTTTAIDHAGASAGGGGAGLLQGTELYEAFLELIRGRPGGDHNPHGCKGKPQDIINRHPVTVDSAIPEPPPTIPLHVTGGGSAGAPKR